MKSTSPGGASSSTSIIPRRKPRPAPAMGDSDAAGVLETAFMRYQTGLMIRILLSGLDAAGAPAGDMPSGLQPRLSPAGRAPAVFYSRLSEAGLCQAFQ